MSRAVMDQIALEVELAPHPMPPAARRMRLHRERKKNGMRCVMIELRETEIDAFVQKGFLKTEMRNDVEEIANAIYAWLDRECG
jgi:hypothetical protein